MKTDKSTRYRSIEELPVVLSHEDLQRFLGISHTKTYELCNDPHFPTISIGSRMFVLKDSLMQWLDVQERNATHGHK